MLTASRTSAVNFDNASILLYFDLDSSSMVYNTEVCEIQNSKEGDHTKCNCDLLFLISLEGFLSMKVREQKTIPQYIGKVTPIILPLLADIPCPEFKESEHIKKYHSG